MRISLDTTKPLTADPSTGHNRWHPDIEPIARIGQNQSLTLETRDGFDGQLTPTSSNADVHPDTLNLGLGHPLTGPIFIEGAMPGDILEVEFVSFESREFGVAAIIPGFGFLADLFEKPFIAKFDLQDGFARSDELPGIAIPSDIFPGVVGVAPSQELMEKIHRRESDLSQRGGIIADQEPETAVPSIAANGLRTIPPREIGGNMDTRGLTAGSRAYFPVYVPGALFSIGDLHFAQGDGETCGTAIEIAGSATVSFQIHKTPKWRPQFPAYETPPQRPRRTFSTTGIPLNEEGRNESMSFEIATRRALLEMISWLETEHNLSPESAYILISTAVDLRLSEIVDIPNPLVSAVIPLDIFETPSREEIVRKKRRTDIQGTLATERRRERALTERVEQAIRNLIGWRTDTAITNQLDSSLVETLQKMHVILPEPKEEARSRMEEKVKELETELAECHNRQQALLAYLELLN